MIKQALYFWHEKLKELLSKMINLTKKKLLDMILK